MGARFLIARAEMRRNALALVLLGLLAGLVGATVTGVATVARRSATAYERLERATVVDDARGAIIGVGEEETRQLVAAINAFDGVAAARVAPFFISRFREGPITFPSFALLDNDPALPFQPVVVEGRALDPSEPDEVVLIDSVAAEFGIGVGAVLPVRLLQQQEMFDFDAEIDPPIGTGPEADLTVVGLIRISGTNDSIPPMFASPAFRDAHPGAESSGVFNFVDLRDRSDWPAFDRAAQEAGAGVDTPDIVSPVSMAATRVDPSVTSATRLAVGGMLALGVVAALAGLALIVQLAGRRASDSADADVVLQAIGLRRQDLAVVALILAGTPAALAAVGAVVGAIIGGHVAPIGVASSFEPSPGAHTNLAVALLGALTAATVVLASMLAARLLTRPTASTRTRRTSRVVQRLALLGAHPARIVGLRYVFERRGRAGASHSGMATGAIGIAGVVGAIVVGLNLHAAINTPARYGWPTQFVIADANEAKVREIERDDRIGTIVYRSSADVRIDGRVVPAVALDERRGTVEWSLSEGRPPRTSSEVVLGVSIARALGKHVGDVVVVTPPKGPELTLQVVGEGVVPTYDGGGFGKTVALTPTVLDRAGIGNRYDQLGVDPAPSVSPERFAQELGEQYEFSGRSTPPSVDNLAQIRDLPLALGGGLSLLALISMAYAVNGVARHRRRDLAVLTALGFTRRNRLAVLITFATVLALVLATVGGFAGLIAGSSVWRVLARDAALASTIERPVALLLTVPVTAVVALALGAGAAARTWRMRPGPHLRAE